MINACIACLLSAVNTFAWSHSFFRIVQKITNNEKQRGRAWEHGACPEV